MGFRTGAPKGTDRCANWSAAFVLSFETTVRFGLLQNCFPMVHWMSQKFPIGWAVASCSLRESGYGDPVTGLDH
jgi:hypothetical protein